MAGSDVENRPGQQRHRRPGFLLVVMGLFVCCSSYLLRNCQIFLVDAQLLLATPNFPREIVAGWNLLQMVCGELLDGDEDFGNTVHCSWNIGMFAAIHFVLNTPTVPRNTLATWAECLAESDVPTACNNTVTSEGIRCSYCDYKKNAPTIEDHYIENFGPGVCLSDQATTMGCRTQKSVSLWHIMQQPYYKDFPKATEQAQCLKFSANKTACLQTRDARNRPCGFCNITGNLNYHFEPTNSICFQDFLLADYHWCDHLSSSWPVPSSSTTTKYATLAAGTTAGTTRLLNPPSTTVIKSTSAAIGFLRRNSTISCVVVPIIIALALTFPSMLSL